MKRLAILLVLIATPALAADKFVTPSGAGAKSGDSWGDALPGSFTPVRGNVYYFADGSYSGRTLNTPTSSTQQVTFKKCTTNDGVSSAAAGYASTLCDGQAVFGDLTLGSDYWTIDGTKRNESNWADGSSYGFRISSIIASTAWTSGVCASNITLRYINAGGNEGAAYTGSEPDYAFKVAGFDELCTNWTIQRTYAHNVAHAAIYHMNGLNGGTFEHNWLSNSWGKEAIRGQIAFANVTIRHNVFKNACGYTGVPGEGCTAEIAAWDGSNFSGNQIYGNIFHRTNDDENSGGTIVIGGNGSSWVGTSASNTIVYNNTIAGIAGGGVGAMIIINGGTGNICKNNLWYNVAGTAGCTAGTSSDNGEVSTNPFVNYAAGDFRLSTALQGTMLSSPYNLDLLGRTRGADGVWDRGAYEFSDTVASAPAAPTNLSIVVN